MWTTAAEVKADELTYTLTNLVPDTDYVAQIIAVNKEGKSEGLISQTFTPRKILCMYSIKVFVLQLMILYYSK